MPQRDRYEPLPGLGQLPGFLVRKLSPRGRRLAAGAAALLLAGAIAGVAFGLPAVQDTKRDRAATLDRAAERERSQRIAVLRREQRPRRGRGTPSRGLAGAEAVAARRALAAELAVAVERDAATRDLEHPVEDVECERYPRGARGEDPATELASRSGRYACLAITRRFARSEASVGGSFGYPYRAKVDFPTGRFTFCKVSGRPGEGSTTRAIPVRVPPACGG